jgi:hypothetical protein
MEVVNESPFEVALPRTELAAGGIVAALIVKSTFDLIPDGTLRVSSAPMPLVAQFLETPYGIFHSEYFFKKQGVDLCVLGSVRRATPVERAHVRLSYGARSWELVVHGDRRWQRLPGGQGEELVPSRAEPFLEIPIAYTHAFGGEVDVGGMPYGHPANPKGRGYYRSAAEACSRLLPNIEDARLPDQRLFRADDERLIVGWGPYPNFWALRGARAVHVDPEVNRVDSISPSLFNHAHPDLVLNRVSPGAPIVLEGLSDRVVVCPVPSPPTRVEVNVGAERFELDAPIDGLFYWADDRKLVVTQRGRFKYTVRPEERRLVKVRPSFLASRGDVP